MLFTHFADSSPISTLTPLSFMHTPTAENVSKFSWFPFLLSWRRRNFLGKRFTFLAARELLVEAEARPLLSAPPPPLLYSAVDQQPGTGFGGGVWGLGSRTGAVDFPHFAELRASHQTVMH